ncbi:MAG TPA: RiPP maturation radical SAM C-methyltransferase [Thermoanaerobaculia bacterium]|nr:RiPP maturation radical SAM C-methyltransferase [Thermoanaerobaculia bacterium]
MPHPDQKPTNLSDPLRLALLHASFRLANEELGRRRTEGGAEEGAEDHELTGDPEDSARLAAALRRHVAGLDLPDLERLRSQLAGSFLLELDRRMAAPGEPPGERLDATRLLTHSPRPAGGPAAPRRVGLVSLPWMSPAMPSIQLATLASALEREGLAADVHELYVDYAARIGLNLYNHLSNLLGYVPEWVFSRHYYGPEHGDDLAAMLAQDPLAEIPWPELAGVILEALEPVTREYLDDMVESVDWSVYDVLGISLTISQLGASMAFARRIKLRHPGIRIVFGGSQCAGPMGRAVLRICPSVDVVVHVEGELVLGELVRRLRGGQSLEGLPGVSSRGPGGEVVSGPPGGLYRETRERLPLSYDAYFRRLIRLGLLNKIKPWLPFEGSRGCWYGQKVQCTFCGLHEIMEFRAWNADAVLAELERLFARYGIGRFYAMDLIMPREYLRTLLPEVARRGHDWMFFWEIKANMRREELEVLAEAGVRWVQPGIESLDADLLHLMKKGVSPLQNVLLLKWCRELEIFCGWNLLFGLPGETAASYERMAGLIPKLHHLRPPSGGGRFQLHRFSPYFDHPEEYGIRWTGAHPMFQYAFPVPKDDLDELVYLHEFVLDSDTSPVDCSRTEAAVLEWRRAYRRGATLGITVHPDRTSRIVDTRQVDAPARVHLLSADETALYLFLDSGAKETSLEQAFQRAHPQAAQELDRQGGVTAVVERWLRDDLVLAIDGRIVALALRSERMKKDRSGPYPPGVGAEVLAEMKPDL